MPDRPLSDFHPRERLASVPHTTRRFACRSALALSPDARTLAVVSDQGAGTYEAWTLPATGGAPARAVAVAEHAVRSLCWSATGELLAAADKGGTELHQLYLRHPTDGGSRSRATRASRPTWTSSSRISTAVRSASS